MKIQSVVGRNNMFERIKIFKKKRGLGWLDEDIVGKKVGRER